MNREAAKTQMIDVLRNIVTIPDDVELTEKVSLRDDLGMDSLASLTFLMELEETIENFTIDPDNLEETHFESIGAMVEYIVENAKVAEVA